MFSFRFWNGANTHGFSTRRLVLISMERVYFYPGLHGVVTSQHQVLSCKLLIFVEPIEDESVLKPTDAMQIIGGLYPSMCTM